MNEKIVPKRWRPVFTFPMIEKIIKMVDYITAANTIYPQSLREAERRRDYQTQAIITVEQIVQLLQYMLTTLPINPDKFQPVTELLTREAALLRGSPARRPTLSRGSRRRALSICRRQKRQPVFPPSARW